MQRKSDAELSATHDEVWDLMNLSRAVKDELNAVVLRVDAQMSANRGRNPEEYDRVFKDSKRQDNISHEVYVADHLKRWETLGLSEQAQNELLTAAEFCWIALHDPDARLTEIEREKAEVVRKMMKDLGGPPPCCDENLFAKGGQT